MFKDDELHETRYCENCLKLQQELQEVMDNYVNLDLSRVKEYNELVDKYKAKEQECEKLKRKSEEQSWRYAELDADIEQLKAENETYKKMLDNPEIHVALTDVRTGERNLWQKYKPRMEQAEQKLGKIELKCKETLELMNKDSGTNAYAGGRCTEAGQILQIIDEVE